MDSRLHGNDGKKPNVAKKVAHAPSVIPLLLSFPRKRESIFTWQGGCRTDTNRRMDARMDSRLHGNDGKKSPDGKRPPLSPPRKEGDMKEGSRASFPLLLSFPRKRESIFTWQGGCRTDTNRRMDARMDSRFHGNDEKKPDVAKKVARPPFVIPLLLSFPRKRESIFTWQGGCRTDTNRRMDARMDSRLHGNDEKRPDVAKKVIPPPSVIPAKAGIHLHMARRVSDRHKQTDGCSDGFPFSRE